MPDGITEASFDVFGAAGGSVGDFSPAGLGGEATATIPLTPGNRLTIMVGGQGQDVSIASPAGGFNGGGNGGSGFLSAGAGGGGASDVRIGGTTLADRAIVAGGGGGAANVCGTPGCGTGGGGGGSTGGTGGTAISGTVGGAGGNQNGSKGSGQPGHGSAGGSNPAAVVGGGGGGGGFYGGAGGPIVESFGFLYGTGGGGGSGFGPAGVAFQTGVRSGDGRVVVTYSSRPECDSLEAFVSRVEAQIGITLTPAAAKTLIDSAKQMEAQLGC